MLLFPYIWQQTHSIHSNDSACKVCGPDPPAAFSIFEHPNQHSEHLHQPQRFQDVFYAQATDPSASAILSPLKTPSRTPQTLTEKIVQRYSLGLADGKVVKSGDYVTISPFHCMTHDNSWPVALKFMSIGASKIHDPKQIVMTLDHDVQNKSETNLKKYRHWPGTMTVASDSHSNMYGGVGCLDGYGQD